MHFLRKWFGDRRTTSTRPPLPCLPSVEVLEPRDVPTLTTISSTFNGTAIPAGSSVWFSSVGKVSGLGAAPVTIRLTHASITSGQFTVAVPDTVITISPTITTASTVFDAQANTWVTSLPRTGLSGNVFLAGATLLAPNGLPGGIKPVTWTADFTTDTPGVNINWQWAAAVYTRFSTDLNALAVKPIDGSAANPYSNSDHAGTPENFKPYLFGGARGGGGSNFTGSYSATKKVTPSIDTPPPPPGSLSGYVYFDANGNGARDEQDVGLGGVVITLFDGNGNAIAQTPTDDTGFYSFDGLTAGAYSLSEEQPFGYDQGTNTLGSLGGTVNFDTFTVAVGAGDHGTDYNFGELLSTPNS